MYIKKKHIDQKLAIMKEMCFRIGNANGNALPNQRQFSVFVSHFSQTEWLC